MINTRCACKISKVKTNKKINLFIDVTKIVNKLGSECIAIDCENKKKNITPLTFICDQNKLPLAVSCVDINKKIYNGRNTAKHEIKNVSQTLNKINIQPKLKIKDYVDLNLIGDKAYITKNTFEIMNKNINIITPKKKNQLTKNTTKEKTLLKDRHKIENLFAYIKKNNRTMIRKDKKINNYLSFIYMTLLEKYISYALFNNLEKYL